MSKLDEIESYLSRSAIEAVEGCDDLFVCAECGDDYSLRDGCEPTPCCDDCSHTLVFRLRQDAEYLVRRCRELEKALERTHANFKRLLEYRPVRDASETLAEAECVLKEGE